MQSGRPALSPLATRLAFYERHGGAGAVHVCGVSVKTLLRVCVLDGTRRSACLREVGTPIQHDPPRLMLFQPQLAAFIHPVVFYYRLAFCRAAGVGGVEPIPADRRGIKHRL